jgi:hypothetical protein
MVPNAEIVETELRTLLSTAGGDYVRAYEALVEQEKSKALEAAPRTTKEERKSAWRKALAKKDRAVLGPIYEKMRGYVAKARVNAAIVEQEPSVLDENQAAALMQQFLDLREIEKIVKADREAIKERVIASMTESLAAQDQDFPENTNAQLDVPELGFYFDRYGCGRKDPEVNLVMLQAELGDELFNLVTTKKVVTTFEVDIPKLMAQAQGNPVILEKLRRSLTVGDWKSPSFTARPLA